MNLPAPDEGEYRGRQYSTAAPGLDTPRYEFDFPRIFRTQRVDEYIVERDDAGSPPRLPEAALDTARVGHRFLRAVRF